jgi:hypothetical protein
MTDADAVSGSPLSSPPYRVYVAAQAVSQLFPRSGLRDFRAKSSASDMVSPSV